jgi:hypothetical protein
MGLCREETRLLNDIAGGGHRLDVYLFPAPSHASIGHNPVDFGKQGVVGTFPYVSSGKNPRSPLPDKNASGIDLLAAEAFNAKHFRLAVSSVPAASYSLFVCHTMRSE